MAIEGMLSESLLADNPTRQLGSVGVGSDYREDYLALLLKEVRWANQLLQTIHENRFATLFAPLAASGSAGLSSILGADVTLTSTSTFFDGPSITCPPGTWLLLGSAAIHTTVGATVINTVKLWDGTTVLASAEAHVFGPQTVSAPVASIVSPIQTTIYKISAATNTITTTTMVASTTNHPTTDATYLLAIQMA